MQKCLHKCVGGLGICNEFQLSTLRSMYDFGSLVKGYNGM